MSEPKLIRPLLDGFIIGEPISDHHGVRCCPAIRENTDERYIVKIISIPASQVQLDALLLTGACADHAQALDYFKELSDGVVGESDILDRLSRMEGFVPYLGHQIHEMDDGIGYDVYLLNPYRRSLEKLMRAEPLTHLAAVNLGLDMCAALAACRRAGYLYVDLKPTNIFRSENHGYFIGDLGFISLSSLKYASLPEKYRSNYTAPEISDAMSSLNDTIDIYALGLTLYQVYNNGELPFDGTAPAQILPPPMYADYEMAEIILKACAPNPWDRWQDPAQMGQALVNYMQRNSINDTPIVPPPVVIADQPDEIDEFLTEEENDAELAELLAMIPDEEPPADMAVEPEELPDEPSEEIAETETSDDDMISTDEEPEDATDSEDDEAQLTFLNESAEDEASPSEEITTELTDTGVTSEVAQILAQADDLISHELPEPVVAPAPIDVPIPPPITLEPEEDELVSEEAPIEDASEEALPAIVLPEEDDTPVENEVSDNPYEGPAFGDADGYDEELEFAQELQRHRFRCLIAAAVTILLLFAAGIGGYFWHQEYYLQTIEGLEITGNVDYLQVVVTSDIDDELLTVYCTDVYGNAKNCPIKDGIASFSDLNPGTQYRIHVAVSGLHKLKGTTTGTFTTTSVTQILNFTANNGAEDGSVVLNFSVNGTEPEKWIVEYRTASDSAALHQEFTGHSVTISGLTVGSEYDFRLIASDDLALSGTLALTFTPVNNVSAEDLTVTACGNGTLRVQWTLPEGTDAQNWIVRCSNGAGFDQILNTAETTAEFTGLDHTSGYTVTVTAEGSSKTVSTEVTADPINVTGFNTEIKTPWAMTLSWDFTGTAPANGWVLTYTIDGGEPITINCAENSVIIPLTPNSSYAFEVSAEDERTFFAVPYTYGPVQTPAFEGYYVTANNMSFSMYLGSKEQNAFAIGEKATLKGALDCKYGESDDTIVSTFVIRSADNELISEDTYTCSWKKLWKKRACTLEVPQLPDQAGAYSLDLYFNGMYVATLSFTIA